MRYRLLVFAVLWVMSSLGFAETQQEQRNRLFERLNQVYQLSPDQLEKIKSIFASSSVLGQGNPDVSSYRGSKSECLQKTKDLSIYRNTEFEKVCHGLYMAPIYNSKKQNSNVVVLHGV